VVPSGLALQVVRAIASLRRRGRAQPRASDQPRRTDPAPGLRLAGRFGGGRPGRHGRRRGSRVLKAQAAAVSSCRLPRPVARAQASSTAPLTPGARCRLGLGAKYVPHSKVGGAAVPAQPRARWRQPGPLRSRLPAAAGPAAVEDWQSAALKDGRCRPPARAGHPGRGRAGRPPEAAPPKVAACRRAEQARAAGGGGAAGARGAAQGAAARARAGAPGRLILFALGGGAGGCPRGAGRKAAAGTQPLLHPAACPAARRRCPAARRWPWGPPPPPALCARQ
jgi:hypothetical protein